ncbi:MAG: hypothetical protein K6A94_00820 [Bacteroidales bacterium]|nr:hypothetical protein [Bacteroidales bacterium]
MKRGKIKETLSGLFKAMDQNGYGKCEVMELTMKTCITKKAELFIHVEASISEPGEDGKSFMITKDFDL